jgi:hypothetical protein
MAQLSQLQHFGAARRDVATLHMLEGWLLASILGIGLGSLIGSSRTAMEYFQPACQVFTSASGVGNHSGSNSPLGLSNETADSVSSETTTKALQNYVKSALLPAPHCRRQGQARSTAKSY